MSTFEGKRTIDGLVVTVDGERLDEHYDVQQLHDLGLRVDLRGRQPQAAGAGAAGRASRDNARAIRLTEPFMRNVVANLDNDWVLQSSDIDRAIREIEVEIAICALASGSALPRPLPLTCS